MRHRRCAVVEVVVAPNVARLGDAPDTLSYEDRSRASALPDPADRERFVAGRQLLREVLAERTGRGPHELRIGSGVHGRPFLLDDGPSVAVAHGGDWCAVALSNDCAVGLALGELDREPAASHLSATMHEDERRAILAQPPERRAAAAARWWAILEATAGACGTTLDRVEECRPLVATHLDEPVAGIAVAVAGRTKRALQVRCTVRGDAARVPVGAA